MSNNYLQKNDSKSTLSELGEVIETGDKCPVGLIGTVALAAIGVAGYAIKAIMSGNTSKK